MEVLGAATGILGLAGVFTACVDCFECIQLGRNFQGDFAKNQLKLAIITERLTRWGASVGLYDDKVPAWLNQTNAELVRNILNQILDLFENLDKKAEYFQKKHAADPGAQDFADPDKNPDPVVDPVRKWCRNIISKRQSRSPGRFGKRVYWAIYEKKNFDQLVGQTTDFVDALVDLFPQAKPVQRQLIEQAIEDEKGVQALIKASDGYDGALCEVGTAELNNRQGHNYKDNVTEDQAMAQWGDMYGEGWTGGKVLAGSSTYQGNRVSGNARALHGNSYGANIFQR